MIPSQPWWRAVGAPEPGFLRSVFLCKRNKVEHCVGTAAGGKVVEWSAWLILWSQPTGGSRTESPRDHSVGRGHWLGSPPQPADEWASPSCPVLANLGPQCCSALGSGFLEVVLFHGTIRVLGRLPFLCFCGMSTCLAGIWKSGKDHIVSEELQQNLGNESSCTRGVSELACRIFLQLFGYCSKGGYNGEGVCVGMGGTWEFPALSFLLCYNSKSSLKIWFINFFKKVFSWGGDTAYLRSTQHHKIHKL